MNFIILAKVLYRGLAAMHLYWRFDRKTSVLTNLSTSEYNNILYRFKRLRSATVADQGRNKIYGDVFLWEGKNGGRQSNITQQGVKWLVSNDVFILFYLILLNLSSTLSKIATAISYIYIAIYSYLSNKYIILYIYIIYIVNWSPSAITFHTILYFYLPLVSIFTCRQHMILLFL